MLLFPCHALLLVPCVATQGLVYSLHTNVGSTHQYSHLVNAQAGEPGSRECGPEAKG